MRISREEPTAQAATFDCGWSPEFDAVIPVVNLTIQVISVNMTVLVKAPRCGQRPHTTETWLSNRITTMYDVGRATRKPQPSSICLDALSSAI